MLAVPLPTVKPLTEMSPANVLPAGDTLVHTKVEPFQLKYVLAVVGAETKVDVLGAD